MKNLRRKVKIVASALYDGENRFRVMNKLGLLNSMPDEEYLKRQFKAIMGNELNLDNPKTFNEKLQWLKLYNRRPEYTKMVDKYAVKEYIASTIGERYIIPTLGVWDDFVNIDFNLLPNQFVLKCTHDSGGLIICKDKSKLNYEYAKKKIEASLKRNFYWVGREWPYKNVKPRIIAEKYMVDTPDSEELTDYKFHCFNGKADSVMVCYDRKSGDTKYYFFDKDWKLKKYNLRGIDAPVNFTLPRPNNLNEMFFIAEELSKGIPFVRVDLYSINQQTYFGELTFFPQCGYDRNLLYDTDLLWGSMINLEGCKRSFAK